MSVRLYRGNGSHPCATVEAALELKGISYRIVELIPPLHAPVMRVLFGRRTVPAMTIDGEKISGSRAILRRLDELVPEPALLPADADQRAAVLEAEAWGDEVLQPLVRRVLWPTFRAHPEAMASFQEGGKLPPLPLPVLRLIAPGATRLEMRMNGATDATYRADLRALLTLLDRIDGWIAAGVLGAASPNAADLQIAASLRLLMCLGDLRPLIEPRPAGALALKVFPSRAGDAPTGLIPADLLPA